MLAKIQLDRRGGKSGLNWLASMALFKLRTPCKRKQGTLGGVDKMKTVVIWDRMGQEPIQYFVVSGDWSKFNNLYINTYTDKTPEGKRQACLLKDLTDLVYNESGTMLQTLLSDFPIEEVKAGAKVIVCGFLP
jgi:hypothetical protein